MHYINLKLINYSSENRDHRLDRQTSYQQERLKVETPGQKSERLKKERDNKAFRRQNDTELQRYDSQQLARQIRQQRQSIDRILTPEGIASQEKRLETLENNFGDRILRRNLKQKIDNSKKWWQKKTK